MQDVQGNLLREYEQTFAELPEQQQLTKLCSNTGFLKITSTDLKLPQDGDTILLPRRIHLRHHDGNQAVNCGQLGAGIRGTRRPGLNSIFSSLIVQRCHFACQKCYLRQMER